MTEQPRPILYTTDEEERNNSLSHPHLAARERGTCGSILKVYEKYKKNKNAPKVRMYVRS